MMISVFDSVENNVGKRENADQHFLLFPQCFQKISFPWSEKTGIVNSVPHSPDLQRPRVKRLCGKRRKCR